MNQTQPNTENDTIIVDKQAMFRIYNACVIAKHTLSLDDFEAMREDLLKIKITLETSGSK